MSITARVARRFQAGFIPDKFWKTKKSELKAILAKPMAGSKPYVAAHSIFDEVIPFLGKFVIELLAFGVHTAAEVSIKDRLDTAKHILGKIAEGHQAFDDAIRVPLANNAKEEVTWTIAYEIENAFEKKFPTLGDCLRGFWKTDRRLLEGLAGRLLKKATPAEATAVEMNALDGLSSRAKYEFFKRVNLEGLALKTVTREKVAWDPFKWMDFLKEVLVSNFTQDAVNESNGLTEFDLYGLKVVIQDNTVTPEQTKQYIKYLDEAYNRFKAKGLSRAWYGTLFIQCEECGGTNPLGADYGVGGHYHIGPNTISCYVRPRPFVVELMAHELGHRFWFKHMTSEQRARFEGLVKVHKTLTPGNKPVAEKDLKRAEAAVTADVGDFRILLDTFNDTKGTWPKAVTDFAQQIFKANMDLGTSLYKTCADFAEPHYSPDLKQEMKKLSGTTESAGFVLRIFCLKESMLKYFADAGKDDNERSANFRDFVRNWVHDATVYLERTRAAALGYLRLAYKLNKEGYEEGENRPVTPVSDYGKSNIDEAFAEVFAHYIIGKDMDRDQLESFKSVLSSQDPLVRRILTRWAAGG